MRFRSTNGALLFWTHQWRWYDHDLRVRDHLRVRSNQFVLEKENRLVCIDQGRPRLTDSGLGGTPTVIFSTKFGVEPRPMIT